jgi:Zn-dependent metalloprotease
MAHEYAHGVTLFEADLLYANESGAINESYSDIFGEFIDLANGRGNDSASVRWLIGEDFPGHIRNMADPPDRNHPDRKGSPLYVQPGTDPDDNGGVHKNSGINNKLCYLLTDGDTFNGQTVRGMGTNKVADLYYHALAYLLGPTSDFTDLYYTLRQAAANLNWSMADRNNVYRGCAAVEIAAPSILHVNWTGNPLLQNGSALLPYTSVIRAYNESWPGDELLIHDGTYRGNLFMEKEMLINSTVGADVIIRGQ